MPDVLGLYLRNQNPILCVISDQLKNSMSSSGILRKIIENLKNGQISWPRNFQFTQQQEWIRKMKIDPTFYRNYFTDASNFEASVK